MMVSESFELSPRMLSPAMLRGGSGSGRISPYGRDPSAGAATIHIRRGAVVRTSAKDGPWRLARLING